MGNLSIQSTSTSTSQHGIPVSKNPPGVQAKSNPSQAVAKTDPNDKSAYRKVKIKLDPKMSAAGGKGGKGKSGRPMGSSFACRIFQPLPGSKIRVQALKGSANLNKPFSKNLIDATAGERNRIHAQAIKDAKILLTQKDNRGRSLKTRLYDMLVRHWTRTGQSVMEYPQFERYLRQAMQTKINWASNHFWNKFASACQKDPCRTVEQTFRAMSPTTLGVGGVVEQDQVIPVSKKQCAKSGPCVRSSNITLTTQSPIISVRDDGIKHPKGLAHTVAHEFLHVFFRISGAIHDSRRDHGFTRSLGLGGTDDFRTAYTRRRRR